MAKLNYIEQFREIALHPIVKFEVVAVRLCVLLASIHYGFDCWWMDMVLAAYLLFVFNRFIPHLLLLVLWTIGKITWLEHTQFKVEMVMLEVVLLCCLVFRKFQPQNKVKAPLLIENQMQTIKSTFLDTTEDNVDKLVEKNHVEYNLIENFPVEMQKGPSYILILTEIERAKCFELKSLPVIEGFLCDIANHYNNVPYHNLTHGLDVAHSLWIFLNEYGARTFLGLSSKEYVFMLIAAYCHDVGHMGFRNMYYQKTRHQMAVNYFDNSILEHYHCSVVFQVTRNPNRDIFALLPKQERDEYRRLIIKMILATDMAYHDEHLHKLQSVTRNMQYHQQLLPANREIIQGELLHAADLGSSCKPFEVAQQWVKRLQQEFYTEETELAERGLQKYPTDDGGVSILAGQIFFIDKFCLPLYTELHQLIRGFNKSIDGFKDNKTQLERLSRLHRSIRT